MKLFNLFRPGWRHSDDSKRLKAVSKIKNRKTLRKIADQSKDERLRFEAACRLNDLPLIRKLSYSAPQESVRLKASIRADRQSNLTSIALNAWDIHIGQKAVDHIDNELLLHRIARSAKQDAVRLAAALKSGNTDLLRSVARSSTHIEVHWQVAQRLDDPQLFAEIILLKPANMHLEPLRRKARRALTDHLNRCQAKGDHHGLEMAMKLVPHPSFKLEAFVRLAPQRITFSVLRYLAAQDFRYIPKNLLNKMIDCIRIGDWQVRIALKQTACIYCLGKGELTLKYLSANDTWRDHDRFPCPDCNGKGKTPFRSVTCRKEDQSIQLKLPV